MELFAASFLLQVVGVKELAFYCSQGEPVRLPVMQVLGSLCLAFREEIIVSIIL